MMKTAILSVFVLLLSLHSNGQYKVNKTRYDYHTYTYQQGDRYNPDNAGLASFFIPGLGQAVAGETGRGLVFLGGSLVCCTVFTRNCLALVGKPGYSGSLTVLCLSGVGEVSLWIWSIIDAQHVAKVNSLAWRDKNKSSFRLQIQPCISQTKPFTTEKIAVGISMKITLP